MCVPTDRADMNVSSARVAWLAYEFLKSVPMWSAMAVSTATSPVLWHQPLCRIAHTRAAPLMPHFSPLAGIE